jgi:regulator of nonsense transcripts 2
MDMEFIVQDTFSLTRPQWKLATNLEEASKAFQLAVAQDQKNAGVDKAVEQDDASSVSSDEDNIDVDGDGDADLILPEGDGEEDSDSVAGDEVSRSSASYVGLS